MIGNKRILVIDDDRAVRMSFTLAFEEMPYDLDTAETGEIGIDKYGREAYDLVYLDLKMPGMGGVQTLRELRRMGCGAPIYIITAFHEEFLGQLEGVAEDGLEFELLRKPVGQEQLRTVTASIFGGPLAVEGARP